MTASANCWRSRTHRTRREVFRRFPLRLSALRGTDLRSAGAAVVVAGELHMRDPLSIPLENIRADLAIVHLENLLAFYADQESAYYLKLWGDDDSSRWDPGTENEWDRYRCEAAALRMGIAAIKAQDQSR